jgi:cellulose biosynthesis protein BcsQ
VSLPNREHRLRTIIHSLHNGTNRFDRLHRHAAVLAGLLTLNALVAADAVLIPLNCG